jgi:hypothetical protein
MGRREGYPIHLRYKTEQIALSDNSELGPQLARLAGLCLGVSSLLVLLIHSLVNKIGFIDSSLIDYVWLVGKFGWGCRFFLCLVAWLVFFLVGWLDD